MNELVKTENATDKVERAWATPATDIFENEQSYLLLADLPGVQQERISLAFDNGALKLEAAGEDFDFKRSFKVDGTVEVEKISARLEDGVLRIELPKPAEKRAFEIPVV